MNARYHALATLPVALLALVPFVWVILVLRSLIGILEQPCSSMPKNTPTLKPAHAVMEGQRNQ